MTLKTLFSTKLSNITRRTFQAVAIALLSNAVVCSAQSLSATTTIHFDQGVITEGMLGLPASAVFVGSPGNFMSLTIRQWSDGSITAIGSARTEQIGVSNGVSRSLSAEVKVTGTNGVTTVAGQLGGSSTSTSSASNSILNSFNIGVTGNLVSATVVYTTLAGITVQTTLDLGVITELAGFSQFTGGVLADKNIFATPLGGVHSDIVLEHAPATSAQNGKLYRGFVNASGKAAYVSVLDGYWLWVARVNGKITDAWLEPVYKWEYVGFSATPGIPGVPIDATIR